MVRKTREKSRDSAGLEHTCRPDVRSVHSSEFLALEPCGLALRHSTGVEFLGDRFEVSERLGDGERIHFLTKAITGL